MTTRTWSIATIVAVLASAALVVFGVGAVGAKTSGKKDSGIVYAAETYSKNGIQYVAGNAKDKLFGNQAVTYALKIGPGTPGTFHVKAKRVTTWSKTGSLSGTATATLIVNPDGTATITNGKLKETKGTGTQKGHRFVAAFSGTGTVSSGRFIFKYKGRYS